MATYATVTFTSPDGDEGRALPIAKVLDQLVVNLPEGTSGRVTFHPAHTVTDDSNGNPLPTPREVADRFQLRTGSTAYIARLSKATTGERGVRLSAEQKQAYQNLLANPAVLAAAKAQGISVDTLLAPAARKAFGAGKPASGPQPTRR